MTTTVYPFIPTPTSPFQFQAIFDGATYLVTTRWNVFAQRWYVEITNSAQERVLLIARIGSPRGVDISMTAGYFTTKLIWRDPDGQFEVVEP